MASQRIISAALCVWLSAHFIMASAAHKKVPDDVGKIVTNAPLTSAEIENGQGKENIRRVEDEFKEEGLELGDWIYHKTKLNRLVYRGAKYGKSKKSETHFLRICYYLKADKDKKLRSIPLTSFRKHLKCKRNKNMLSNRLKNMKSKHEQSVEKKETLKKPVRSTPVERTRWRRSRRPTGTRPFSRERKDGRTKGSFAHRRWSRRRRSARASRGNTDSKDTRRTKNRKRKKDKNTSETRDGRTTVGTEGDSLDDFEEELESDGLTRDSVTHEKNSVEELPLIQEDLHVVSVLASRPTPEGQPEEISEQLLDTETSNVEIVSTSLRSESVNKADSTLREAIDKARIQQLSQTLATTAELGCDTESNACRNEEDDEHLLTDDDESTSGEEKPLTNSAMLGKLGQARKRIMVTIREKYPQHSQQEHDMLMRLTKLQLEFSKLQRYARKYKLLDYLEEVGSISAVIKEICRRSVDRDIPKLIEAIDNFQRHFETLGHDLTKVFIA